jgi:ectoine hydroxylase-related dioxygenase (phytanoyl-CoA dioxygenase family)
MHVPVDEEGYTVSYRVDQEREIQEFFDTYGFVVTRDVLSQEDCSATLEDIFNILETYSGFYRGDIHTWSNWPADSIERYGSPHKPPIFAPQFLRNRQNPNVYRVFSLLLNEKNLLVNHDRCCFFRPTKAGITPTGQLLEHDMPAWSTAENLHIDMNPHDWMGDGERNRQALDKLRYDRLNEFIFENNQPSHADGVQLQGVLNLYDNKEEDGGYQCVPGFHRQFDDYFKAMRRADSPSYNFKPREGPYRQGMRVSMRAGSMVVWDQRMAHGSKPNSSPRFRSAQFIKLFPAHTVSSERARARSVVLRRQIRQARMEGEVTELGRMLFGLNV